MATCISNSYEAVRNQRVELNKKKFEDLGILKISKCLGDVTTPEKKSQQRLLKPKSKTTIVLEPRRSSRARNPVPSYRDDIDIEIPNLRKRSRSTSWGSYLARPIEEVKAATQAERERAFEAAVEIQSNLESENPSFVKSMVRSHVYSCFWLGLPSKFCEDHLPKTVLDMVLEDENGAEFDAIYIGKRAGLSGGWRAFALDHKLDDGDALVFELIEPARFKIYIVKASPLSNQEQIEDTVDKEVISATKKKSKAGMKLDLQPNQTRKSRRGMVHVSDDLEIPQKLQPESETGSGERIEDTVDKEEISANKRKSKAGMKLDLQPTRKSRRGMVHASDDLESPQKLQPESETSSGERIEDTVDKEKISANKRKSKAGMKLDLQPTRKSRRGTVHANDDLESPQKLQPESETSSGDKSQDENPTKKNGFVSQNNQKKGKSADTSELKKVEIVEDSDRCAIQKPRKKPAPKLLRRKAY